jgi:hypothetical protein
MSITLDNQGRVRRTRQRNRRIASFVVLACLVGLAVFAYHSQAVRELYWSLARVADGLVG